MLVYVKNVYIIDYIMWFYAILQLNVNIIMIVILDSMMLILTS